MIRHARNRRRMTTNRKALHTYSRKETMADYQSTRTRKVASWLDDRFILPGTNIRFGLDPIIGLIPGVGDWASGMISTYFILLGVRADLSPAVLARMGFNILLDIIVGSIPLLGDAFDVGWKSNVRNARLLEKYQSDSTKTERHSRWVLWSVGIVFIILVIIVLAAITWLIAMIFKAVF